jgi:membrane-anchored protein YejM (alkaline phosphatase superfamily)
MGTTKPPFTKRLVVWFSWFSFLILCSYLLPYTVLTHVPKMYGAYLFWVLVTLAVILSAIALTMLWRD